MDLIITILAVVTKDLPISVRFSTLTIRQPIVEFYLLTFPRFPLRKIFVFLGFEAIAAFRSVALSLL